MEGELNLNKLYENKSAWYELTKDYWNKSESNSKGMLGGNTKVNSIDISFSMNLLEDYISKKFFKPSSVLEIGAGIGRVTKNLLINYFTDITLVEQSKPFIDKAKETLEKSKSESVKINYIAEPMQSIFENEHFFGENSEPRFSAIWIQWCIENLDDDDLTKLLTKCKQLLLPKGMIFIKENVVEDNEEVKINDIDFSRVRNDKLYKEIFKAAGLRLFKHIRHPDWPEDLMSVSFYVLM